LLDDLTPDQRARRVIDGQLAEAGWYICDRSGMDLVNHAGVAVREVHLGDVLFFDKKPASETPWTSTLWVYDFRTNQHFTMKQNPLRREHLQDFVDSYKAGKRDVREESERFKAFTYDELMARDEANLDIIWLEDESLDDAENLPAPEVIAQEIVEELQAALNEFAAIAEALSDTRDTD
jgi:type I restriction enzyme M protein